MSLIGNIASTYVNDTIVILGKGPSADEVRKEVFVDSLVIAVNDAERIAPADITLFHADWVKRGLVASGHRSRLYVTSCSFSAPNRDVVHVPYVPMSQESSDLVMHRLMAEDFALEDMLFLSALKIARLVAQQRGRPQTVYLVGFDFEPGKGVSRAIEPDYAPHMSDERETYIPRQEYYLLNTLYFLQKSDLDVRHVGNRSFSALTTEELNHKILGTGYRRAQGQPHAVSVVAELTTNHFGDRARLERMIRAAYVAGADYVKLQKRDVDSFYTADQLASAYKSPFGTTFRDYRMQLELSDDDFEFVNALCLELGIDWFASILDRKSFEHMLRFERKVVKLPSTISEHTDYLDFVARNYREGIVLSTGMTDQAYERWVLENFTNCSRLILMQANSAYPTPLSDCNIGVVRHYDLLSRRNSRVVPAYSSHDFGAKASCMAVAAGARMVEKHVKFGNTEWAHFDAVAVDLTTSAFKDYVSAVREAELIVGEEEKKVNSSEHHKYFRKSA